MDKERLLVIVTIIILSIGCTILHNQYKSLCDTSIKYINSVHNLIEEQEQFILDYSNDESVVGAIEEGINYEEYIINETKLKDIIK